MAGLTSGWFGMTLTEAQLGSAQLGSAQLAQSASPSLLPPEKPLDLMAVVEAAAASGVNAQPEKLLPAIERAKRLKALGFDAVADPLLARTQGLEKIKQLTGKNVTVITPKKIEAFLNRIIRGKSGVGTQLRAVVSDENLTLNFVDHADGWRNELTVTWVEAAVAKYKGIPPDDVLGKLEEAKKAGAYDYFTIATVDTRLTKTPIRDPLLLGRINGSTDRYFLAQWGDDISLDDVI